MAESTARRRGRGEDAIYFDAAKNRYVGAVSLGFGPDGKRIRRKVTGRTKQDVRDKLKAVHAELDRGLRTSSTYTVRQAVTDWLAGGMPGRTERTRSVYHALCLQGGTDTSPAAHRRQAAERADGWGCARRARSA
jgi:hypothetical protein